MRIATIVAVTLFAREASGHALDIGYLRVEPARVVLDLDRVAVAQLLGVPQATLEIVRARAGELAAMTYARELPATAEGPPCTLDTPKVEISAVTVRLGATMSCPPGERTWRFPFVTDTKVSATFELLVKDVETDRLTVVDRMSPSITFAAATASAISASNQASASTPRPGNQGRSTFLIGGLLVGVMLAPLARFALRR